MKYKKLVFGIVGFFVGVAISIWIFFPFNFMLGTFDAFFVRFVCIILYGVTTFIGVFLSDYKGH